MRFRNFARHFSFFRAVNLSVMARVFSPRFLILVQLLKLKRLHDNYWNFTSNFSSKSTVFVTECRMNLFIIIKYIDVKLGA